MARLLIVDDEQSICWALGKLAEEMGMGVCTAASAEQGLEAVRTTPPDVLVLDVRLPGMDGLGAMQHFRSLLGPLPIIVITAFGDLNTAVSAVRNGAFDYLLKPFDLVGAERAIHRALRSASQPPAPKPPPPNEGEEMIVGAFRRHPRGLQTHRTGRPFRRLRARTRRKRLGQGTCGPGDTSLQPPGPAPFIAVNVASLNPSLAESELFGHVRAHSPARIRREKDSSSRPTAARFFSMKSPTSPWPCR